MGDEFIPLTGEVGGIGPHEYCQKDPGKAHIKGAVKDGKFVSTSFKLKN